MPSKKKERVLKTLWVNIRKALKLGWETDSRVLIWIFFLTLVSAIFPVLFSYFYKLILDEIVTAQNTVGVVTITLISLFAFRYILELFDHLRNAFHYEYIERIYWYKLTNTLSYKLSQKLSELDLGHFENPEIQNLIEKARQGYNYRISNFILFFSYMVGAVGGFAASFVVLLPFGWWIPVLMTASVAPRFFLKNKYTKVEWDVFNLKTPESKELSYLMDILDDPNSVKEIKIFQAGPALLKRLAKIQSSIFESQKVPLKNYMASLYIPLIIELSVLFALAYTKLGPTVAGVLTIGSYIFYAQMLDRLSQVSQQIGNQFSRLYENSLYVGYFFDIQELPKLIKEPDPGYKFEEIKPPKIEFHNVSFAYQNGPTVLKNISFSLDPGQHLAIVGPNGAGKTTLIKLLLRFYDPTKGDILINDVNLKEIRSDHWYKFLGILFQDFVKFFLTIKDNIMLGDSKKDDEDRMIDAAQKSGADEFIAKLPKKYNQRLGKKFEDAVELSQGQWQKLALARTFYEEAPILILDEPTSAIDAEAEAQIFENLYKIYEKKTLVLISHRFSTVRNADKIIVLKNGKIAEEGDHESLIKQGGVYATMFRKQAKGYIE